MKRWLFLLPLLILAILLTELTGGASAAPEQQPGDKVPVLIGFTSQPGPAEEALVRGARGEIKYTYKIVPSIAASVPEAAIPGLLHNPHVTRIEPDGVVHLLDAELDNAWGVKHIGAGLVHDLGNKGAGVKVGILDTGIDTDHSDLAYDPSCSYDFRNSDSIPEDGHSHGTHVAGTVAALDNGTGVVGVAPEVTLCIYKVFDDAGNADWSDIIAAVQRAAMEDGVQVTNNSYGDSSAPTDLRDALNRAYDEYGVLHFAGAGNNSVWIFTGPCIYPALWPSVIAVGATTSSNGRASFSSVCPEMELAAPGQNINSTWNNGLYGTKSGTSMASPHAAGTAALIIASGIADSNGNGRVNDEVRQRLIETADDLGSAGHDSTFGYGLVDVDEAAQPGVPPTARFTFTCTDLACDFDGSASSDADGTIVTYDWDFGDGATGSGATVSHTYATGRTYNVTLTVTDNDGATGVDSQNVTVTESNAPPAASFTFTCTDLACDFDGSASSDADGTIVAYDWDFGDGATGSGATVNHSYATGGTYNATLTVTDNDGATGVDSQNVTVDDIQVSAMHVGDLEGTSLVSRNWRAQVTITVHDDGEGPVMGATVNGAWSGDTSGTGFCTTDSSGTCDVMTAELSKKAAQQVVFTVTSVGHATLSYNAAANHDPQSNSSGTAIQVNKDGTTQDPGAVPNHPPVASYTYDCIDLTCSFDASGSSDPDGTIVSYAWNFGDGGTATGQTVNHTFAAGTHQVTLTVTDDEGNTADGTQQVSVGQVTGITLTAVGYKVRAIQRVDLTWTGATTSHVDIYRDGSPIATSPSDGVPYTDNLGVKSGGPYSYYVCEAGDTAICSEVVIVTF